MKSSVIFVSFLLSVVITGTVLAGWVPLTGDPVPLSSLPGGILIVGDKEFSGFDLIASSEGGAIAPNADTIYIQGGRDDVMGDYGVRFRLPMVAFSNQSVGVVLDFGVSVLDEYKDWYIKDVSMILTGVSANGTGEVVATETVSAPAFGEVQLICAKEASDGGLNLEDYAEFDLVKEIWVHKEIAVAGGTSGVGHLSDLFQFYSQIPEPATICLLGLGTLVLLRTRKRRA